MTKVTASFHVPAGSLVTKDFGRIDHVDTYRIESVTDHTVDAWTTRIFRMPGWIRALLSFRNLLVKPFGLKSGDTAASLCCERYEIGSRAVYFTVIDRNENELVMGEKDHHLDFRTSVLVDKEGNRSRVCLTTIVHFNNWFGRLYFIPVKPFHRLIVRSLLKKIE